MDELYAKEVEEILNLGNISKVKRKLDKLIESSNHDHYVIAAAIEYKLKHNFGYCTELINEIVEKKLEDYFQRFFIIMKSMILFYYILII